MDLLGTGGRILLLHSYLFQVIYQLLVQPLSSVGTLPLTAAPRVLTPGAIVFHLCVSRVVHA
eukprot:1045191-Amphidinium_carterae.1